MSESTFRSYRPLAPRTELPSEGGDEGGSPNGSAPEERRMRRVSTACTECQRRRTRCSGTPHCSECKAHNRDCVFDEASDRRRKASAKRTQDQLDQYRSFVDDLLGIIRDHDDPTLHRIVGLIRSGASIFAIREMLNQILGEVLPSRVHGPNVNMELNPNNTVSNSNKGPPNTTGNHFNPTSI